MAAGVGIAGAGKVGNGLRHPKSPAGEEIGMISSFWALTLGYFTLDTMGLGRNSLILVARLLNPRQLYLGQRIGWMCLLLERTGRCTISGALVMVRGVRVSLDMRICEVLVSRRLVDGAKLYGCYCCRDFQSLLLGGRPVHYRTIVYMVFIGTRHAMGCELAGPT
jgi:hypothetical protein